MKFVKSFSRFLPAFFLALGILLVFRGPSLDERAWLDSNFDEWFVIQTALKLPEQGLNPKRFDWPSVVFYQQAAQTGFFIVLEQAKGTFQGLEGFKQWYYEHPENLLSFSRLLMLLCWAVSLGLVSLLVGSANWRMGLMLVAGLAISPMVGEAAAALIPEGPMFLFSVLGFLCLGRRGIGVKQVLMAGLFFGFAVGSKYPAVFSLLMGMAIVLTRQENRKKALGHSVLMGTVAVGGFFLSSPFALLDFDQFIYWLRWQMEHTKGSGHPGFGGHAGILVVTGWVWGLGPLCLAFLPGLFSALGNDKVKLALIAWLIGLFYFATLQLFFMKYLLALLPGVLVLYAAHVEEKLIFKGGLWLMILTAVSLPFGFQKAVRSWDSGSRGEFAKWAKEELPSEARVALDAHLPELPMSKETLEKQLEIDPGNERLKFLLEKKQANFEGPEFWARLPLDVWKSGKFPNLSQWVRERDIEFVVVFEGSLPRHAKQNPQAKSFYRALMRAPLMASFGQGDQMVKVFDLRGVLPREVEL